MSGWVNHDEDRLPHWHEWLLPISNTTWIFMDRASKYGKPPAEAVIEGQFDISIEVGSFKFRDDQTDKTISHITIKARTVERAKELAVSWALRELKSLADAVKTESER